MKIKYVSAFGVTVNFSGSEHAPYQTQDLFDSTWDVQSVTSGAGSRIKNLTRSLKQFNIRIATWDDSYNNTKTKLNYLHSIFDKDCQSNLRGRLYVDDAYMLGNITDSKKDGYPTEGWLFVDLTFSSDSSFWITEEYIEFPTFVVDNAVSFILPTKMPFIIGATLRSRPLFNSHYTSSKAVISMFGPVTDPQFMVGTHLYKVSGTLTESERFEINQQEQSVIKITQSGERINVFAQRSKTDSVFKPIPSGESLLYSGGDFTLTILLFMERGEPLWN